MQFSTLEAFIVLLQL